MNNQSNDILTQAASVWKELTNYYYIFTYGYKRNLYKINLTFTFEVFPHLAGFHYLKDLTLPRYNPGKTVERILDGKIKYDHIIKSSQYEKMVKPRLESLIRLKDIIENDFTLFSYIPRMYPFTTTIKADYLISSHLDLVSFIFIIQSTSDSSANCNYLCCSTFTQSNRNYETNQKARILLKKERIHINSNQTTILFDKLTKQKKY